MVEKKPGSNSSGHHVRVGTRGSRLALAQTRQVIEQLHLCDPSLFFETIVIRTRGDRWKGTDWPEEIGTGVFVREIEDALLRGEIDLAVHSLKDLPARLPEGLLLAAVLERGDPRDVLVARDKRKLAELHPKAVVGTGSPRRSVQLASLRPDFIIKPIRGNITTRLDYVAQGKLDGVVLAAAGIRRLDLSAKISEYFSVEHMVPAVGQGVLVVEARRNENWESRLARVHHRESALAVRCERSFLEKWGGGCRVPLGAYACKMNEKLVLRGMIESNGKLRREVISGSTDYPELLGEELAMYMRGKP